MNCLDIYHFFFLYRKWNISSKYNYGTRQNVGLHFKLFKPPPSRFITASLKVSKSKKFKSYRWAKPNNFLKILLNIFPNVYTDVNIRQLHRVLWSEQFPLLPSTCDLSYLCVTRSVRLRQAENECITDSVIDVSDVTMRTMLLVQGTQPATERKKNGKIIEC